IEEALESTPTRLVLVGKSLGTRAMLFALERLHEEGFSGRTDCVWLTPVIGDDNFFAELIEVRERSLFVIGDADPHFDKRKMDVLENVGDVVIVEDADHALEVPGNLQCSISELERVTRLMQTFVGGP
ncbi:MAG: hypothetical protein ABL958_19560, partial [Bdellovibrionia bacterium]